MLWHYRPKTAAAAALVVHKYIIIVLLLSLLLSFLLMLRCHYYMLVYIYVCTAIIYMLLLLCVIIKINKITKRDLAHASGHCKLSFVVRHTTYWSLQLLRPIARGAVSSDLKYSQVGGAFSGVAHFQVANPHRAFAPTLGIEPRTSWFHRDATT